MPGTIDFSIEDLAPTDIEAMLKRLEPALNDTAPSDWCVDCQGSRYLGPSAAVLLATTVLERRRRGQALQVRLPTSPPKLRAFCSFSGLDALVGTGPQPDAEHPMNETAQLHAFTRESFSDSTPIVELVRRHVPSLDGGTEDILRRCFAEVAQNVQDHAQSPIGGLACARFMSKTSEIRLAFADRGLGILGKLRASNPQIQTDEARLRAVLEGQVSSKSRKNNMGLGINNLATIAKGHRGKLMLVSNEWTALVQSGSDTPKLRRLATAFPGTAVFMSLRVPDNSTNEGSDYGG